MPTATYGTRTVIDERDDSARTVKLTAPAGTKQVVVLQNAELGDVSLTLWPFPTEARREPDAPFGGRTRRLGH